MLLHFHYHGIALKLHSLEEKHITGQCVTLTISLTMIMFSFYLTPKSLYDVFRRYTKFYGSSGNAAADIAHDAIRGKITEVTKIVMDQDF